MKSEKALAWLAAVLVGFCLSACGGSTTFASSWRSPKAEPLDMRGEKVAAVVMMSNEATRRNAEDILAREITHYGAQGIPMYTLFSQPALGNEAAARAAVEKAGVKGIVVMRPVGTKERTETHESYSGGMYDGYWGGYYGYGWGGAYGFYANPNDLGMGQRPIYINTAPATVDTYTTTTTVVQVEVLVYSLKQNLLVWAGQSETTDTDKLDDYVTQLAAATVKEMGAMGLLSSK